MWYIVVAMASACFGFLLCSLLVAGRRADEREDAAREYEDRLHATMSEMCARCREMDEERADAREWERM